MKCTTVVRQARVGHGLDSSMDWIGLDWVGLDWVQFLGKKIGLDWIGSEVFFDKFVM